MGEVCVSFVVVWYGRHRQQERSVRRSVVAVDVWPLSSRREGREDVSAITIRRTTAPSLIYRPSITRDLYAATYVLPHLLPTTNTSRPTGVALSTESTPTGVDTLHSTQLDSTQFNSTPPIQTNDEEQDETPAERKIKDGRRKTEDQRRYKENTHFP